MATHKLGKLKINTSGDGIAFRFGEGKIHRFSLGKKARDAAPDYNEEDYLDSEGFEDESYAPGDEQDYAPESDYEDDGYAPQGYSGRFAQPRDDGRGYDGGYDDDYADGDYDDDGYGDYAGGDYADGDYADDGYAQDGYDGDGYADGGYYDEDGYAEDAYGDEGYDDRYSDEDAGDYAGQPYASENPILRYVDENDWVTYALLVLLPPLGIYLLWRRRRFEMPVRWAVSSASGVWFVILMILLISALFAGGGDTTTNPLITMTTPTPTVAQMVSPSPDASAGAPDSADGFGDLSGTGGSFGDLSGSDIAPDSTIGSQGISPAQTPDALAPDATATPIAAISGGSTGNSGMAAGTVITQATAPYYHNNASCTNIVAGAAVNNVTESVAVQQGKVKCPICYPGQSTYYSTDGGTYYHTLSDCSNMSGASQITKEAAEAKGQKPCPVCVTRQVNSIIPGELVFLTANDTDKSGLTVYATRGGRYFHTDPSCGGMNNPASGTPLAAMLAGKKACPDCADQYDTMVWCTRGGGRYHNKQDCDGMRNAVQCTLAEAMSMGKKRCTLCWGNSQVGTSTGSASGGSSTSGPRVWATPNGNYYHTEEHCSNMTGAVQVSLLQMIQSGRPACPTCASGADQTVWATRNGRYYHSYATCSGMDGAVQGTLAQALALGKERCPDCWSSGGNGSGSSAEGAGSSAGGTFVYATRGGVYYHTRSNCSGMSGASRVTLNAAVSAGKRACPTCASAASRMVYSTDGGTYYHVRSNCSNMSGAKHRTLESALMLGQRACPTCIGSGSQTGNVTSGSGNAGANANTNTNTNLVSSGRYDAGTSGIRVWATAEGRYYHTSSTCGGMQGASHITLETAMNYGKTACPTCASSANTTVYAVRGKKYYHYSKTCAGSGAVAGKRATALAMGLDPCPYCVSRTQTITSSNRYDPGTSGIKVWASVTGKYYHADQDCAGASASRITLETALNYGKTACPSCASSASITVYATPSDRYYHSSQTHAGAGAVSGSFAKALALGKKECPVCIGGSESYEQSDIKYSAPGDTKVYIDVDSDRLYYHRTSRCSDAGLSNGTGVMLDFVVNWGYKACPFCNPPTSVG